MVTDPTIIGYEVGVFLVTDQAGGEAKVGSALWDPIEVEES